MASTWMTELLAVVLACAGLVSLARCLWDKLGGSREHQHAQPKEKKKIKSIEETLLLDKVVPFDGLPINQAQDWPRYWKAGQYQMTMGLRKMDPNNWLTFDEKWKEQHEAKLRFTTLSNRQEIVDYLDGEDEAAVELLDLVVAYVTRRFPAMFRMDGDEIVITPTAERYRVVKPYDRHPVELANLLVMDDLYVLKKGVRDLYYLRGAMLAAPTGWRLDQRIGWPVYQLHDGIPLWKEKLRKSMERYFVNMKADSPIQRNNLFIQPTDGIFHHDRFETYPVVHDAAGIFIRTELQSLRRLPRSQAVIFTVRTYLANLTELRSEPAELERLWDAVRHIPDNVGEYKVKHLWNDAFERFCKETLRKSDPEIDPETGNGTTTAAALATPHACPMGFA